jgi:hypothetical protein
MTTQELSEKLLKSVLALAQRGWPVFPCHVDKSPHLKGGFSSACTDPSQITAWWRKWPTASIGVPTGAAISCFVLDVDLPDGPASLAALEETHGPVPETTEQRTGSGGRQLFFVLPDGVDVRNSTSKVGKNLDIRGNGGYVIVPPSGHPSGGHYAWTSAKGIAPAAAPQWLLELALKPKSKPRPVSVAPPSGNTPDTSSKQNYAQKVLQSACENIRNSPSGEQHETRRDQARLVGGYLQHLDEQAAYDALEQAVIASGAQDVAKAMRTVRDGLEHGKAEPVQIPDLSKWEETPRPLRRPMPMPADFPMDALGDVLTGAALAIQGVVKAPAAMCGQSILAAAALAVQGYADIAIDGRVRPVSLFALTWGDTGERKSEVDNQALWPHRKHERALNEHYDQALPEYEAAAAAWKKSRDKALTKAKDYAARKQALKELGPAPDPPLLPLLCASEPTIEGLVKLMAGGQPSMGLFSDEGGKMLGGYAMSDENILKTAAGFSDFWDGKPPDRVRAGDGASKLYGRRLSLHLMAQPVVATKVLSSPILAGQGFLSRCLTCWPESTAGTRIYEEVDLSTHPAVKRYGARVLSILETPLPLALGKLNELAPRQIALNPDAKKLWIGFHDHVEMHLGEGKIFAPIRGFANKAAEHAARIAGVLALVEDLHRRSISKRSMEAGIALCEFYLSEALRLFEAGACDPDLVLAEKLLSWALAQGEYIHLAQVYQFGPNALRDAKTARRIAGLLQDHGWLRSVEDKEIDGMKRREAWQVVQTPRETAPTAKPASTANAEPLFSTISDISRGEDANPEFRKGNAAFPEHDVPVEEPAKNDAPATHYRPEVVL